MVAGEAFPGLDEAMAPHVRRTLSAMATRGFGSMYMPTRQDALAKLFELIPKRSAVAHGSSTTLEQVGLVARLRDPSSAYRYMSSEWVAENGPAKRAKLLAKLSVEADYFLGSVQAI